MKESWNIKDILDWTTQYFTKHEIDSARLDAELLLSHVLKLKRLDLYMQFDRPLQDDELKEFKELIKRRSTLEPVAYILGDKEFYSRDFLVDANVLIPRPETELLVETVLKNLENQSALGLEVGVGSGAISVSLLCENPNLKMLATDISEKAIAVAKENAGTHKVLDRLTFLQNNFLDQSLPHNEKFNFLISNPPYVSSKEYQTLPKTILDFEPKHALDDGADGLNFYRQIAEQAKMLVKEGGLIAVEIGEDQGQAVSELFKNAGLKNISVQKDYADHDRIILANV